MAAFEINHLNFTYPGRETKALEDVCLRVEEGAFTVLCGSSGSGKSTLLRHLKTVLTPHGQRQGDVYYKGRPLCEWDNRAQTAEIGFVFQSPENQIVTDKVWHELAFGLESLGCSSRTIRMRVAETASFFDISHWFHRPVAALSGGQKQLLSLASVMVMAPSVLLLDEPTAQLDPLAAERFLDVLKKINRELGTTILLSEHRLETVLPVADQVVVMEQGRVAAAVPPRALASTLRGKSSPMLAALPSPVTIYNGLNTTLECPLTVGEGRLFLSRLAQEKPALVVKPAPQKPLTGAPVFALKDVWFRYEKQEDDIVRDCTFSVGEGELFALLGSNGSGKSTLLSLMAGLRRPYRGAVTYRGKPVHRWGDALYRQQLGVLPQNPTTLFSKKTVELDLADILPVSMSNEEKRQKVEEIAAFGGLTSVLSSHPYDLSGGEQQRAALCKVLLTEPQVLLLDEPTKGMDVPYQAQFAAMLHSLCNKGGTVILISHDVEFCARHASRCALLFDGGIVAENHTVPFFTGNRYYTTAANRMARHLFPLALTSEDVIEECKKNQLDG